MRRRDWLLSVCAPALGAGCRSVPTHGDVEVLARRLKALQGSPVVLFVWAPWSRSAIELEPTMSELQEEYRAFGVEFIAVSLGSVEPLQDLSMPTFALEGDSLAALEQFGVGEVPAVLTLARDGRLGHRLQPNPSSGLIDSGDIVDAIEAVAME